MANRAILLAVLIAAAVAFRGELAAQWRGAVVLAEVMDVPVGEPVARALTREPILDEIRVAGAPTTRARPAGSGPWPVVVFVNGATPKGRGEEDVVELARGLARAGFVALVPDLPGLRQGAVTTRTARVATSVALSAVRLPEADGDGVALIGVSVGGTLALLAAADPELAPRVKVVAAVAPFVDLPNVVRLATTGRYATGRGFVRYETDPFLALAVGRSLVASLPPTPERDRLGRMLAAVDDDHPDPLAIVRDGPRGPVAALLANRDPRRFDSLYARLPADLRRELEALSPIRHADRLRAPIEITSAPHDTYFPILESRRLEQARPDLVTITVTGSFTHAIPKVSWRSLDDFWRLNGVSVRTFEAAA